MSYSLPASMRVFERGWLSANNILFLEGEGATLVDSGYHSPCRSSASVCAAWLW